jgi:RecA/RadA recombinase
MKFPILEINEYLTNFDIYKGIFSVWGDFGVGKTTFALQTAINTAKDKKKVIYIYTKPNLPSEKITALSNRSEGILDKIIIVNPLDFEELNKIVFNLEFLILKNSNKSDNELKLIIIDSITELYRLELNTDKKEKNYNLNYQLNQILANLTYLNEIYGIEILIVNEISRKNYDDQLIEVQSGGKVMEFWVTCNLKITKTKKLNERKFILAKIPENQTIEFTSLIREKGF